MGRLAPSAQAWAGFAIAIMAMAAACFLPAGGFSPERDIYFFPVALLIGLVAAFELPDRASPGALLFYLFVTLVCVLLGRWHAGLSSGEILAGRIPWNDSGGYLGDALRFQEGYRLNEFSSRRPIHVLVLAALIKLAGGDLGIASFLFAGFAAIALAALGLAVRRSHGKAAAIVLMLLGLLYYRRFVGTTMSEHAGFILGCLATALLWRGAETRSRAELYGGLFLLTVALAARAGCFVALPFLVLWIGWILRRGRLPGWRPTLAACAAVAAGLLLNDLLIQTLGVPGAGFSNFPVVFYGLVFGGDWTLFYADHPEFVGVPDRDVAPRAMDFALQKLRHDPLLLPAGMLRAWAAFFKVDQGQFNFLRVGFPLTADAADFLSGAIADMPGLIARILRRIGVAQWPLDFARWAYDIAPWFLFAVGALVTVWRRRSAQHLLLVASWAGILLSIPFVPPWDADAMRAYAATMPLQLLVVAVGAAKIGALMRAGLPPDTRIYPDRTAIRSVGLAIAACLLPVVIFAWFTAKAPASTVPAALDCPPGREPHLVKVTPGGTVPLAGKPTRFLDVDIARFRRGLEPLVATYPDAFAPMLDLPPGASLVAAINEDRRRNAVVGVRDEARRQALEHGPQTLCSLPKRMYVDIDETPSSPVR